MATTRITGERQSVADLYHAGKAAGTMQAVQQHEFGGPAVLRYEAAPRPGLQPGEVLVRVHAVSLNPPDWYLREGYK